MQRRRFSKSPIYHGLEIARRNNVPWLVVARGSEIRLYPTSPSVGVGRRGATQTYFGLDLALIDESKAGYLDLAFSAKALAPDGSVDQILNDSKTYVAALSSRLRDRVYEDVVSRLSVAVAEKLREAGPLDADQLSLAYRLTLKILFRLLFQAYAEDIRVLPFQRNERYTAASLKQLARHMADELQQADSSKSTSLFDGLLQVWRVIDHGDPDWGVPAYNGGLFGTDPDLHPDGAAIEKLALTNDILGPALRGGFSLMSLKTGRSDQLTSVRLTFVTSGQSTKVSSRQDSQSRTLTLRTSKVKAGDPQQARPILRSREDMHISTPNLVTAKRRDPSSPHHLQWSIYLSAHLTQRLMTTSLV